MKTRNVLGCSDQVEFRARPLLFIMILRAFVPESNVNNIATQLANDFWNCGIRGT